MSHARRAILNINDFWQDDAALAQLDGGCLAAHVDSNRAGAGSSADRLTEMVQGRRQES